MPVTVVPDDGFVPVKQSKRRQNRYKNLKFTPKTVDDHISDLEAKALSLASSKFYSSLSAILDNESIPIEANKTIHIRCLALGSPTDSLNAMFQLALLNLIVDKLGIARERVTMWDPVFQSMDKDLFEKLGYCIKEEEDESLFEDSNNVILYYMIHSPPFLTEKILKQHVQLRNKETPDPGTTESGEKTLTKDKEKSLGKTREFIVIGNNLVTYSNHLSDSDLEEKYPHILGAINQVDISRQFSSLKIKNKKQAIIDVSTVALTNQLDYHEIPDSISRHEDWMTAVNDLAVYWCKRE